MALLNIGILGFGTVGKATFEILQERIDVIEASVGDEIIVKKIFVRNKNKHNYDNIDANLFTDVISEVVEDDSVDIIIEATGDVGVVYEGIKVAIANGKHIITANKEMVSRHFEELNQLANKHDIQLKYEAAVGGAIPILCQIPKIRELNEIVEINGVLNGTCNFILSAMEKGMDYNKALLDAQQAGFAEADPTADVEAYDTVRKLRILATLAFGVKVAEDEITREGIINVSKKEIDTSKKNGMRIKLVAHAKKTKDGIEAFVKPTEVEINSVLGGLEDGENAVSVVCDNAGELVFKGKGAGGRPTAFSILSDFLAIACK
ncbi:MAG: homoserine dehydrogenase [Tissierellia bacterium]|nr:homoserine dehydrogenase [Tissierellia bacterium]